MRIAGKLLWNERKCSCFGFIKVSDIGSKEETGHIEDTGNYNFMLLLLKSTRD